MVRGRKGEYRKELEALLRQGYLRRASTAHGSSSSTPPTLTKTQRHDIDVVIDRLTVSDDAAGRLAESVEAALRLGGGLMAVARPNRRPIPSS